MHKWPQSEKKPARKDGPIVGAFHAHSEELVTGNDPRSQPRSNVFVSRNLNPVQKNYSSIRDGIDDREAYLERERAYTLNQSVHSKRVNVVRAKCPPTNSKLTYTKLYDLRSQLYISNPYGGPKHVQNRLNLINK